MAYKDAKTRVEDPLFVSHHSFRPFIGFIDKKRRFRVVDNEKIVDTKNRPIKYCSHLDGYIFSYYAKLAGKAYENILSKEAFQSSVIGYRTGLGSNIDLACVAFKDIARRRSCQVLCLDISSFFDNLDHVILKKSLQKVLRVDCLSQDWFAVYKAMTKYAWVDSAEIIAKLGLDVNALPKPLCDVTTFREKIRGRRKDQASLIRRNYEKWGIPQGAPISSVLSNIYMIDFDKAVHDYVRRYNGTYFRYSDDIMVVCRPSIAPRIEKHIYSEFLKLGKSLRVSDEKTEISKFERRGELLTCDRPVTYLGFTYDGVHVQLRARTLSRYYRRMTYATRRAGGAAKKSKSLVIYKRKLYRDFSHLGKSNFYTYAKHASIIFKDDSPTNQLKRHIKILKRKLLNFGR